MSPLLRLNSFYAEAGYDDLCTCPLANSYNKQLLLSTKTEGFARKNNPIKKLEMLQFSAGEPQNPSPKSSSISVHISEDIY